MNPVEMLEQDHERVRKLFREYGEAGDRMSEKRDVAEQVLMEVEIHSKLEEEIFYPAVRERATELRDQVAEDYHEHREVDRLVQELKAMNPSSDLFEERFQALVGALEYHIAEEEAELLPKAARALGDDAERVGQQMVDRREQLVRELLPSLGRWRTA
jgi:iron-sulfur cluster repair protein YtfE (RIC family)